MEKITKVNVIGGEVDFDFSTLPDGKYILYALKEETDKDIPYYQRLYGALKNTLYKEGETGYTPKELHELAKKEIFPILLKHTDNTLFNGEFDFSCDWKTSRLSIEGWKHFIEEFKIFAQEHFNCYI